MLQFFLSYAHGHPADDRRVKKLFDDLSVDVREVVGLPKNATVGFLDSTNLPVGTRWSPELVNALSVCRVFVALCSPRYFGSKSCGKEWAVFLARLDRYEQATGERPPALIPLLWVPTAMPDVAAEFQYKDDAFADAVPPDGVRHLIRAGSATANTNFVWTLANRIAATAKEHAIPPYPTRPRFEDIVSAFPVHRSNGVPAQRAPVPGDGPAGPPRKPPSKLPRVNNNPVSPRMDSDADLPSRQHDEVPGGGRP